MIKQLSGSKVKVPLMYTKEDFNRIKDIVLKDVPSTVGIILFGSYAKGTAKEDSDIDVAVLTGKEISRKDKLKILTELRWEAASKGYNTDFILNDKQDFLNKSAHPTLAKIILNEGIYLWKKT
ncbi:MAG: hypothetical protein A2219_08210 [Elusimicrobia bacterium RIFOXYA2_FULL_50_26]|nr:MAG: hypothetical protein A2219_08210 [Elusimicrobia bacterium RIFOXYA2_FULL_50_26]OGS25304.1 MAG: hypothetical protein A2314_00820 [Elusimicrobia bacterium RIFOXYB2_FULL_50_12]